MYEIIITNGTRIVFASIGGIGQRYLFLILLVPIAPIRVANVPTIISRSEHPIDMLEIKHPKTSPGIAPGIKYGSIVSTSPKRS